MKFSLRIEDLEVRSCNENLLLDRIHDRAEIVKWESLKDVEYCGTVAYWERVKGGYELRFINDRPFNVDPVIFMGLAKQGQRMLTLGVENE